VMRVPRLIAPGLTLGAALSNSTHDRPRSSLPVTTRRIGFSSSAIDHPLVFRPAQKLIQFEPHCHPTPSSTMMMADPGNKTQGIGSEPVRASRFVASIIAVAAALAPSDRAMAQAQ